jgi:hypothetical protein
MGITPIEPDIASSINIPTFTRGTKLTHHQVPDDTSPLNGLKQFSLNNLLGPIKFERTGQAVERNESCPETCFATTLVNKI